ncbi:hypothetical protein D6827_03155 [Candidatus Parcubacteria bacterium]|nr:MAG: hypothetical protein D6827_03155 [Candidatus Parcubacteria bacterium]
MFRNKKSPPPKMIEIISGLLASYWGFMMLFFNKVELPSFWWLGFSYAESAKLSFLLVAAGLIISLGANMNGRWRISPFIRLVGHLIITIILTEILALGGSTAGSVAATYSLLWLISVIGCVVSLIDGIVSFTKERANGN